MVGLRDLRQFDQLAIIHGVSLERNLSLRSKRQLLVNCCESAISLTNILHRKESGHRLVRDGREMGGGSCETIIQKNDQSEQ